MAATIAPFRGSTSFVAESEKKWQNPLLCRVRTVHKYNTVSTRQDFFLSEDFLNYCDRLEGAATRKTTWTEVFIAWSSSDMRSATHPKTREANLLTFLSTDLWQDVSNTLWQDVRNTLWQDVSNTLTAWPAVGIALLPLFSVLSCFTSLLFQVSFFGEWVVIMKLCRLVYRLPQTWRTTEI